MTRTCKVCKCAQDIENFYLCDMVQGYRRWVCNTCVSAQKKKRYVENRAEIQEKQSTYRENNRENQRILSRNHYRANSTLYKERARIRREDTHRQHLLEQKRAQYQRIRSDPRLDAARKKRNRLNVRRRRATDPIYKLSQNTGALMRCGLKNKGGNTWCSLVGYTLQELETHLEGAFLPGMSWENYGKGGWVIDHIIPACAFTYTQSTDLEFLSCWALSNLRPLWEKDNLTKAAEDRKLSTRRKNLAKQL